MIAQHENVVPAFVRIVPTTRKMVPQHKNPVPAFVPMVPTTRKMVPANVRDIPPVSIIIPPFQIINNHFQMITKSFPRINNHFHTITPPFLNKTGTPGKTTPCPQESVPTPKIIYHTGNTTNKKNRWTPNPPPQSPGHSQPQVLKSVYPQNRVQHLKTSVFKRGHSRFFTLAPQELLTC